MTKDPAFLFYSKDFLGGVSDLTMEERGQYITLLCLQHEKGRLSRKLVQINIPNISEDVLRKFQVDEDGLYYQERLEKEIKKRQDHAEKQRQRALDGWKKRKNKSQSNKKTKISADAAALPLENANEDVNKNENRKGGLGEKQKTDPKEVVKIFNEVCVGLPSVQKLTNNRKSAINNRIREYSHEKVGAVFREVAASKFLNGDNDRGWRADFDWVMNPNNFIKILEGKYQNKNTNNNKSINRNQKPSFSTNR